MAKLYTNQKIKNPENFKNENYYLKISEDKSLSLKSLKEQMGNKIKITKEKKPDASDGGENEFKISSFENCIKPKRIDYLINNNQSKVILDYENDEIKLDKEINLCKKIIFEPGHVKLGRLLLIKSTLKLKYFFNFWKNLTEYPENHYYDNILEYFEGVKNENIELEFNKNKAKSDYKKLIQDYKTLEKFFCEECISPHKNNDNDIDTNGNVIVNNEEFNLDMKSITSDCSNLNPSDLRADSNYNSEVIMNRNFRSIFFFFFFF